MKKILTNTFRRLAGQTTGQNLILVLALLLIRQQTGVSQTLPPATVPTPITIGRNCNGSSSSNNYKVFDYNSTTKVLSQIGANCTPSLASPGFNPYGGSITFNPVDQMLYYIETTTGNNSIIWRWPPNTCPTGSLAPVYTFNNTFIVGLEYNTLTGDGYQLEFSTGSPPYTIYLRKITSFGPPIVAGAAQVINLPPGINIYQQNGDIVITPIGKMYFVLNNKMFTLDYTTYGVGNLNANYIDTLKVGSGNATIGLSFAYGKLVASIQGNSCAYDEIDISTGKAVLSPVSLSSGTFSATDMGTLITGVGASKKVSSVTSIGGTQYKVQYDVKVKNYGNVNLTNVQLVDSVAKVFGTAFVSASLAPVGTLPSGLTLNPSYDGKTNANIFSAGGTMKASPPDSGVVRISVVVNNPLMTYVYNNSALAYATGALFSYNVFDSSFNNSALNPDPNSNEVPDDPGEGVPTPLVFANWVTLANGIVDFNGELNSLGNYLHWTLQNQQPGTTITLQKSTNGSDFKTAAQMPLQEGSSAAYSWQDMHPDAPVNYYRLQVTTASGDVIYSNTVILRDQGDGSDLLTAGPNPFRESVNLTLSLPAAGRITYRIIDLTARTIQEGQFSGGQGTNNFSIGGLGHLPSGTYILELRTASDRYLKKLVKYQ